MPGIDRETALILLLVSGPPGLVTYVFFKAAEYLGPRITTAELLPLTPLEGWPLPRFTKTKPEVLRGLFKELKVVEMATKV